MRCYSPRRPRRCLGAQLLRVDGNARLPLRSRPARSQTRLLSCVFFFQAEDGIRDYKVTGVQTCALPIWGDVGGEGQSYQRGDHGPSAQLEGHDDGVFLIVDVIVRADAHGLEGEAAVEALDRKSVV